MNLSEIDSPKGTIKCAYHVTPISKTRYFTSSVNIVTSRRRVEIQSKSEMTPHFTMTKFNKFTRKMVPIMGRASS